ncbi:hypothetical protein P154DRAFT_536059 [Amniculicola lignicola CBS 123094]|uniref:Uncharacterized protein n=1 Tax=Amniculicola lignicola CBS 123094 TaxID=1392246 RepID=A0A6A5WD64_9PLEO|nr:hypothetical protein P154DRAFT_536059 [Amniculicola lignicola CBS 123094]
MTSMKRKRSPSPEHQSTRKHAKPDNHPHVSEIRLKTRSAQDYWSRFCDDDRKGYRPIYAFTNIEHPQYACSEDAVDFARTRYLQVHRDHSTIGDQQYFVDASLVECAKYANSCTASVLVMIEALERTLAQESWYSSLQWCCARVRPRIFFRFDSSQVPSHDFMILKCKDGSSFVLDFSGQQFGYREFVYTFEEYASDMLVDNNCIELVLKNELYENSRRIKKEDDYDGYFRKLEKSRMRLCDKADEDLRNGRW